MIRLLLFGTRVPLTKADMGESRSDIVWKIEANTASKYQLLDSELKYGSAGSERRLSWAVLSVFCFAVTAWCVVCG